MVLAEPSRGCGIVFWISDVIMPALDRTSKTESDDRVSDGVSFVLRSHAQV